MGFNCFLIRFRVLRYGSIVCNRVRLLESEKITEKRDDEGG